MGPQSPLGAALSPASQSPRLAGSAMVVAGFAGSRERQPGSVPDGLLPEPAETPRTGGRRGKGAEGRESGRGEALRVTGGVGYQQDIEKPIHFTFE